MKDEFLSLREISNSMKCILKLFFRAENNRIVHVSHKSEFEGMFDTLIQIIAIIIGEKLRKYPPYRQSFIGFVYIEIVSGEKLIIDVRGLVTFDYLVYDREEKYIMDMLSELQLQTILVDREEVLREIKFEIK